MEFGYVLYRSPFLRTLVLDFSWQTHEMSSGFEEGMNEAEVSFCVLLTLRNSKDQRNERMVGTHRGMDGQLILFSERQYELLGSFPQNQ